MILKGGGTVTDVDVNSRTIKGYFSIFGNKDSDGDIITQGAYTKSLMERGPNASNRILHLWMHKSDAVLARPRELDEDAHGLKFVSIFPENGKLTRLQDDTLKLYDQGVLTEHSVGFQIIKSENDPSQDARILKELKLWEGSTVTWGANEMAKVTEVKSEMKPELISRMERLIKALKDGYFTDETFMALEYELTIIKNQIDSLEAKAAEQITVEPEQPNYDELINVFKSNLRK